jgi:hypothetical protein
MNLLPRDYKCDNRSANRALKGDNVRGARWSRPGPQLVPLGLFEELTACQRAKIDSDLYTEAVVLERSSARRGRFSVLIHGHDNYLEELRIHPT